MAISAIRWQAVTKMTLGNHLMQEMNAFATVTAWGKQTQAPVLCSHCWDDHCPRWETGSATIRSQ